MIKSIDFIIPAFYIFVQIFKKENITKEMIVPLDCRFAKRYIKEMNPERFDSY